LGAGTTPGLIHRLVQGYFYPSYTGGLVTTFKSNDAVAMWNDLKELWKYTNPQSTTYGVLQEPLQSEEIWLGIDHAARLIDVLNKGLKLEADAVAKQANAKDAKVVPLPVGLGAKGGEFNTAITNTFVRIVVKNEPIQTVLNEQGAIVQKAITDANAKCWGPD